jgi:putative ABC transport system permease protein
MLFLEALRNVGRRKVRSALTVSGIVIGAFALTVMGGLSEFFNRQIDGAVRLVGNQISITPAENRPDRPVNLTTVRRLERIPGVRAAMPTLFASLETNSGLGGGLTVFGLAPEHAPLYFNGVHLAAGRWLERGDLRQTVVGSNVVGTKHVKLGSTIEWREKHYTVVGIMERTETFPDTGVVIPFETVRKELRLPTDSVGAVVVVPEANSLDQAEEVARRIKQEVPGLNAQSPRNQIQNVRQGMLIFNAIMLSGAVISGVVGGVSVVNTMVMAVRERTREIGLKKAIGASDASIVGEYMAESVIIGLIGGVVGVAVGFGMAQLLNVVFSGPLNGTSLFTVTPRLVALVLGFSVGLSALAGLYPAWSAADLDPVQALRAE